MTDSHRHLLRLSELREQINNFAEDGDVTELAKLQAESTETEKLYREAVQAENKTDPGEQPSQSTDPQVREINNLFQRSKLSDFMAVMNGEVKELEGASREFRAAVFESGYTPRDGENQLEIPVHMFLPREQGLQVYADAATVVNAATGQVVQRPIMERVIERSDALYVGMRTDLIPAGTARYPYLTGGGALSFAAESAEVDASAATIQVEDYNPAEGTMAYLWGLTSEMRFGSGILEDALRRDAQLQIERGMDNFAFQGNAANPAVDGLLDVIADDGNAAAAVTGATFMAEYSSRVDGKYANVSEDVRMLVSTQVYGAVEYAQIGTSRSLVKDFLGPDRLRASSRIVQGAGNRSQCLSYSPVNDRGEFRMAMWSGIMSVLDTVTHANRRQKRLTLFLGAYPVILRNDPWRKHSIQSQ